MKKLTVILLVIFALSCSKEDELSSCNIKGTWYLVTEVDNQEITNEFTLSELEAITASISEISAIQTSENYFKISSDKVESSQFIIRGDVEVGENCESMQVASTNYEIPFNSNGVMILGIANEYSIWAK